MISAGAPLWSNHGFAEGHRLKENDPKALPLASRSVMTVRAGRAKTSTAAVEGCEFELADLPRENECGRRPNDWGGFDSRVVVSSQITMKVRLGTWKRQGRMPEG